MGKASFAGPVVVCSFAAVGATIVAGAIVTAIVGLIKTKMASRQRDLNRSAIILSKWRIANIGPNHAMILAPEANPARIEFSERTGDTVNPLPTKRGHLCSRARKWRGRVSRVRIAMRIAPNGADTGLGVNLKNQAARPFLMTTCKFFTTANSPSLPATSVSSTRRSTSARGIGGSIPFHRQYASAANFSCSGVISFSTPII